MFLLPSTLQVDLSFWPFAVFAPAGRHFDLVFDEANDAPQAPEASPEELLRTAWLYALHARSSIARGRSWQAAHMLDGIRDRVVSLACMEAGLPPFQGRGVDELPLEFPRRLAGTMVRSLDRQDLCRTFAAVIDLLLAEAERVSPDLAARLDGPLAELVESSGRT